MPSTYDLDKAIRKIPGFPKPGILFYDITSILANPGAFSHCVKAMEEIYDNEKIDAVAAIEARGFIFGAPYALSRKVPLVLLRKKGKLPGKTMCRKFSLEYGEDEIHVHVDDVKKGARILVVDDLLATGGTVQAACELLRDAGAEVDHVFGVIGLPFLKYGEKLKAFKVHTLINYQGE
ncbi:MAG: adenine phosphoribosyltransferase [Spirochaetales bacterium]|nr:MAG: adenine phosphoribosyltransferase [Spirochaetales bacterium]